MAYMFAAALVAVVALTGVRVSAQTHHVLAGDVASWSSGRVFTLGDKISFGTGSEDSIVELGGPEEFELCDLTNPIKMYTDPVAHVELDKEGTRYFASANPESCKNGLKLPVSVQSHEFGPFSPFEPVPEYGPPETVHPPPPAFGPPQTPPSFGPPDHPQPPPAFGPPEPVFGPPPPIPRPPSAASYLSGLSFVLFAGLLVCSMGM